MPLFPNADLILPRCFAGLRRGGSTVAKAVLALLLTCTAAQADPVTFPAPSGQASSQILVYSALDLDLATPLITAYQAHHPDVAIRVEELLTGPLYDRIQSETRAGQVTADLAISSAMDLQVKLANDGFARALDLPLADRWPDWAIWRDTVVALTLEPAVILYHKPSFPDGPPLTRGALIDWLETAPDPRIGTYDIARAAVGYLFLSRDQAHFADIWNLVRAMGQADVRIVPTSAEVIEAVATGDLLIGYNILGSYADQRAPALPDLGIALPRDFTVAIGRVALVPRAAANPAGGESLLAFLMSEEAQNILRRDLFFTAIHPDMTGPGSAQALIDRLGDGLRPVPVGPGLLAYVDQSRRRLFLAEWGRALTGEEPSTP